MSTQYSFAPYQDPPEDIPAHERQQAAYTTPTLHSSSQETVAEGETFLGSNVANGDDRINQYETSLPLRYIYMNLLYIDM